MSARGLITHEALREIGLSRQTISARCAAGRLIRVHQGVYFVGHAERTPLAFAEAAVLACGPRAALSHDSAAALYELRRWPRIPEISSALEHRRRGIRSHQTRTLTRADVTVRDAIRVTTTARTLADISSRLTDVQFTRAVHEARRNGDLTLAGLERLYASCPRAVRLVDPGEAPSRSVFQHLYRAFLERSGLPIPQFEAAWHGFEVDALYERHKLIIELDGYRDHQLPDRFEQDRRRDALALELGFATLRITYRRLTQEPTQLADQHRAILAARDPDRAK
jgi:putative AbiEi antitoxin of type IV toxin-antitoxin system/uncharacterized protein DUF559